MLYRGGVIIASDSAATTEIQNVVTSIHHMRKIEVIQERLVLAVAGSSGVAQQYGLAMSRMLDVEGFCSFAPDEVMQCIVDHKSGAIAAQLAVAKAKAELGEKFDASNFQADSLVSLRIGGVAHLYRIHPDMTPERIVESSPFVVVGTGAVSMHAFIEYLRKRLLNEELPDLGDGILTLLWGLKFAYTTGVRDVGGRAQVTIIPDDESLPISQLDDEELAEHEDIVARAEFMLGELRKLVRGESDFFGISNLPEKV